MKSSLFLEHRSIRKFESRAIASELLDHILHCGIRAATSGNMQSYSIIQSTQPEIKQKLYEAHGRQKMILEAPCVLTFCADVSRSQRWMRAGGAKTDFRNLISLLRGFVDTTIVAQAVVSAAECEGLGTCYMGSTLNNSEAVATVLCIPKLVLPVTSIVLGWPAEKPDLRPRLDRTAVIHKEVFEAHKYDNIEAIYQEKDRDIIDRWTKDPKFKERLESLSQKTGAQAYEKMKYSNEELEKFSTGLSVMIEKHFELQITSTK